MRDRPVYLIQPPASLADRQPCLDDSQFGVGMLALSAWLEQHGFGVVGLHFPLARHQGHSMDTLVSRVASDEPLLVAIGMNWVHFSEGALGLGRLIKQAAPHVPVVVGGQHATLFAREIAGGHGDAIDGVIVGEAERPLLALCQRLRETASIARDVPGFMPSGGSLVAPWVVADIDALPTYSYRSLQPAPRQPDVAALSTSRGACPFHCAWCIEPVVGQLQGRSKLAFHGAEHIADQIERLLEEGVDRFTIQDNFFVGGDRKLVELSETLRRRGLRPRHLNVFAHPDSYTPVGFTALAACATRASVDFGVETGSPAVARKNRRRLDPHRVVASIESAVAAAVEPYTWWMAGLPGEDQAALEATERLISRTMRAGGVPRWVSPMILFPGTPIHDDPDEFGIRVRFRSFDDYAAFSTTSLAEALLFADVVTHHAQGGTPEDVVQASQRLRRHIHSQFEVLEDFYREHKLQPDLSAARRRIAASFL